MGGAEQGNATDRYQVRTAEVIAQRAFEPDRGCDVGQGVTAEETKVSVPAMFLFKNLREYRPDIGRTFSRGRPG